MTTAELKRKQRDLNRHRGVPNRLPATTAAQHLALLRQTMSWDDIRRASGCSAAHLRRIAAGKEPRINRATQAKILAITPSPGGHLYVPALGSRRRLQALQARGHAQDAIAAALNTGQCIVSRILQGQPTVRLHVAQRIAATYRQLADTDGGSTRSRGLATLRGWPGPEYWDEDDFDNPDFTPAIADAPRYMALAENARELEQQGYTRTLAAERLGVTCDVLQRALRLHRLEAAA
ncbi:hypothetical protein AB0M57_04395 [Streptomyces sp. NPDC051597]|uniref:hypothetical protein n=1 Tax=Streptomyces sp. NPDC051597 TaxID=3155049 RepID=UPI00343A3FA6